MNDRENERVKEVRTLSYVKGQWNGSQSPWLTVKYFDLGCCGCFDCKLMSYVLVELDWPESDLIWGQLIASLACKHRKNALSSWVFLARQSIYYKFMLLVACEHAQVKRVWVRICLQICTMPSKFLSQLKSIW